MKTLLCSFPPEPPNGEPNTPERGEKADFAQIRLSYLAVERRSRSSLRISIQSNLLSHIFILYSVQLEKLFLHTADNRTDIADFLCLIVWDKQGVIYLILNSRILGRCAIPARISGLTVCRLFDHRPVLNKIEKKTYRTMNNSADHNAYLVEVFLQSERIQHEVNQDQVRAFAYSLAKWWTNQKQSSLPFSASQIHAVLALINTSIHIVGYHITGESHEDLLSLMSQIKVELIDKIAEHLPELETKIA